MKKTLCLIALVFVSLAVSQESQPHFLLRMELAPEVDVMHLSPTQMAALQQHGARLTKLRDEGVVIAGGHTDDPKHMLGIVIFKAKDLAAARALAADDPAVKAGLMKPTLEPFTLAVPPK